MYYINNVQKEVNVIAKNVGKIFEENFKKSIPEYVLIYRPPDQSQSFDMKSNSNLRFSRHSPCDFMLFDDKRRKFWTLELKSFNGSCSFERTKTDKGIIHFHQIESLKNFSQYKNVYSGFILDFRKTDNTYFLSILEWNQLADSISKKSFNENDLLSYCNPILINKKKLNVNYKYDIEQLLDNIESC